MPAAATAAFASGAGSTALRVPRDTAEGEAARERRCRQLRRANGSDLAAAARRRQTREARASMRTCSSVISGLARAWPRARRARGARARITAVARHAVRDRVGSSAGTREASAAGRSTASTIRVGDLAEPGSPRPRGTRRRTARGRTAASSPPAARAGRGRRGLRARRPRERDVLVRRLGSPAIDAHEHLALPGTRAASRRDHGTGRRSAPSSPSRAAPRASR